MGFILYYYLSQKARKEKPQPTPKEGKTEEGRESRLKKKSRWLLAQRMKAWEKLAWDQGSRANGKTQTASILREGRIKRGEEDSEKDARDNHRRDSEDVVSNPSQPTQAPVILTPTEPLARKKWEGSL